MIVCWLLTNSEAGADESEGDSVSDDVSQRHHHRHHHHQQQQSSDSPVARQQWINRERLANDYTLAAWLSGNALASINVGLLALHR